ncbi:MAG: glycosyltransferase [Myxococcaceae bacterium]
MGSPSVSLLMPVRNMAHTVGPALDSVRRELASSDQIVLVDDRSTDGSGDLLRELSRADSRIEIVEGPAAGVARALNAGLERCRGELIVRMDADDESLPGRVRESVAALEKDPSLAAVGTQVEIFRDDQPVSPNMRAYEAWLNSLTSFEALFADRFVESPLCHPSTTIRRAALMEVGGFPDGPFPEDYALWLELLSRGKTLVNLPRVLFRWRDHAQRATREDSRYEQRRHLELKARYLAKIVGGRCGILGAGRTGLALSRALAAFGSRTEFFVDVSPKKVGAIVEGVRVLGHEDLRGPTGVMLIGAVGSKGGRAELRALLGGRGYVEGRDFVCAA